MRKPKKSDIYRDATEIVNTSIAGCDLSVMVAHAMRAKRFESILPALVIHKFHQAGRKDLAEKFILEVLSRTTS